MMLRNMQKTIVKAIPSPELRREIELWNYRFSETDLLKIAYNCAPSFGRMIQLFELVSREAAKPAADYANQLIRWQYAVRDEFCRAADGAVFEIITDAGTESFKQLYEVRNRIRELSGQKQYVVIKRDTKTCEELGTAVLRQDRLLAKVRAYSIECPADAKPGFSWECGVRFPTHIANRALVRYTDKIGNEHFGVHVHGKAGLTEKLYVIPLDSDMMRLHDYEREFSDHEHIYPPFAFSADIAELNDRQKADYFAYLEYLDEE